MSLFRKTKENIILTTKLVIDLKGHDLGVIGKLDKVNRVPGNNFAQVAMHQDSKNWEKALEVMEDLPIPSLWWWNHYMGTANHGLGNKEKHKLTLIKFQKSLVIIH